MVYGMISVPLGTNMGKEKARTHGYSIKTTFAVPFQVNEQDCA